MKEKQITDDTSVVIYLPRFFKGDHLRLGSWMQYTDTWYYDFQKALVDYFSTREDYAFIYKDLPPAHTICNPIPDYIMDKGYENIDVVTGSFKKYLLTVDRMICDYPSTGFFESVVADVPTLVVYHKSLKLRETGLSKFGEILQPFSTKHDAVEKIKEFLDYKIKVYVDLEVIYI